MPLTMAQIASLLKQAFDAGLDEDERQALEWYMIDRAAQLDGATRLDVALSLITGADREAAEIFMQDMQGVREGILQRGAEALNGINDAEWDRLLGTVTDV